MSKRLKIILYVILLLTIIAVIWLMFGSFKPTTESPEDIQINTEEESNQNIENTKESQTQVDTFEEDVMKDLEGFFGNNNGYEDVQGEFGFTNPENE